MAVECMKISDIGMKEETIAMLTREQRNAMP